MYDALGQAGRDLGLRDAGYYALDSLRMEKAYRAWGRELTTDDTPLGGGARASRCGSTSRAVPRPRGTARAAGADPDQAACSPSCWTTRRRCRWGDEPILRDGRVVGTVTSAAFGHTLGRAVAMGYVRDPGGVDEAYVAGGALRARRSAGDRIAARGEPAPRPTIPARLRVKS